jgi:hypothetical protein
MLGRSVYTTVENAEPSVVASKEIGLEVNDDKTKYVVMSGDQFARQSHNITIDNSYFESVEDLKYLGTILTNQNSILEEIKTRFNSGNACCRSLQNLLSSSLLSSNLKIKIYRTIISPFVEHGCEAWSLTFREELMVRIVENGVFRRILGPKRDKVTGEWGKLHNEELNDLRFSPNIVWVIKSRIMRCVGHLACRVERRGVYRVLVVKSEGKSPLGMSL